MMNLQTDPFSSVLQEKFAGRYLTRSSFI